MGAKRAVDESLPDMNPKFRKRKLHIYVFYNNQSGILNIGIVPRKKWGKTKLSFSLRSEKILQLRMILSISIHDH